jgi:RNA polymerase sigma-70 factor, ECF subfamily
MFRQLDSSTVEDDTTPDLAAGLNRLTGWLRRTEVSSRKLVPNESPVNVDSRSLVEAAQHGDRDAFAVLYDRYVDMVFRYVLFRVQDRELAEDITSETFLRALRRITTYRFDGRGADVWLLAIARSLVLDHVRSSRSQPVTTADISGFERTEARSEQLPITTSAALQACVDLLGDDQRRCITLRFLEGQSLAQTAKAMNRDEETVRAIQRSAVRHLAKLLPSDLG